MARKKRPSDLTTHSHAAIRAFAQVVIPPLPLVLRYMMRGRSPWGPAMGCSVAGVEEWIFGLEVGQRLSSASSKKPMTRRSYSAGAVSIALMCGASGTVHSDAVGPAIRA
jgi:hypothetical protein